MGFELGNKKYLFKEINLLDIKNVFANVSFFLEYQIQTNSGFSSDISNEYFLIIDDYQYTIQQCIQKEHLLYYHCCIGLMLKISISYFKVNKSNSFKT